jgi:transcriptional regulator with XRE-family HTH domain
LRTLFNLKLHFFFILLFTVKLNVRFKLRIFLISAIFSSYIMPMLCEKMSMTTQSSIPQAVPAVREHFAKRLKELRIPRGFPTARSLSRALGIDENRYTRYERAEVEPDLSLLLKICGLLRASPNDLLIPTGPAGLDAPYSAYVAEAPSNLTFGKPNGAPHGTLTPTVIDPLRRRAIAWQLASEVIDAGSFDPGQAPLARMQQIKALFGEIEADAFGAIGRIVDDAQLKTVSVADGEKIAVLVEELIAVMATEGLPRT